MADMSKQLPREVEDALLEEACRQWYAFIQEDADRSDGVGFAHFCRTLSEQLLNDKDFMENYQTGFNLPGIRFCDSHYNTLFEIPDGGNVVITHFDGRQEILPCHYIDDSRMKVGETVFRLLEFAEIQERDGSVYAPEHPTRDDICDTYTIYQIMNAQGVPYCFRPYKSAKGLIRPVDYERVYTGVLAQQTTLEDIYAKHNRDRRPFGQQMRSLSVSDIIVLNRNGKQRAYYTDTIGFAPANEFLRKTPQRKRPSQKRGKGGESR